MSELPISTTKAEPLQRLLEAVAEIAPTVSEHAAAADRDGKLDPAVYKAIRDKDLFSVMIPTELGGFEASPNIALNVWEAVGLLDPATGWNLAQASTGVGMSARLSQAGLDDIYGSELTPAFAGAIAPPLRASVVDGGFKLNGRVPFVSGCHNADWFHFIALTFVADEIQRDSVSGDPVITFVFVPSKNVEIVETWDTLGMRGTGSADVSLDSVFVPAHLAVGRSEPIPSDTPFDKPLYRLHPWPSIHGESIISVAIAQSAIREFITIAETKRSANTRTPISEREHIQMNIGRAQALVDSSRSYLHQSIADAYRLAESGQVPLNAQVTMQLAATHAAQSCAAAVDLVFEAAGSASIHRSGSLEQRLRDIHVARQHATKSSARYVSGGRVLLGQPPDVPQLKTHS